MATERFSRAISARMEKKLANEVSINTTETITTEQTAAEKPASGYNVESSAKIAAEEKPTVPEKPAASDKKDKATAKNSKFSAKMFGIIGVIAVIIVALVAGGVFPGVSSFAVKKITVEELGGVTIEASGYRDAYKNDIYEDMLWVGENYFVQSYYQHGDDFGIEYSDGFNDHYTMNRYGEIAEGYGAFICDEYDPYAYEYGEYRADTDDISGLWHQGYNFFEIEKYNEELGGYYYGISAADGGVVLEAVYDYVGATEEPGIFFAMKDGKVAFYDWEGNVRTPEFTDDYTMSYNCKEVITELGIGILPRLLTDAEQSDFFEFVNNL